jgi:hypothetical protein
MALRSAPLAKLQDYYQWLDHAPMGLDETVDGGPPPPVPL